MRLFYRYYYSCRTYFSKDGFTLLEAIVVISIISVLIAVAAPRWLRFADTQRLIAAEEVVYQGMQQAQSKAQQTHAEWQFSIRDTRGYVEWSVHPAVVPITLATWETVGHDSVQIDGETTLQRSGNGRTVRFDHKGAVASRLGRVTLSSRRFNQVKRCVYVSTILGALRRAKAQLTPRRGDFCY